MEIIGYDNDWALVCPNCTAIIKYTPDELDSHCVCKEFEYYVDGLIYPNCGHVVAERGNKRRIIPLELLNESTLYAALHDNEVVVVPCTSKGA